MTHLEVQDTALTEIHSALAALEARFNSVRNAGDVT